MQAEPGSCPLTSHHTIAVHVNDLILPALGALRVSTGYVHAQPESRGGQKHGVITNLGAALTSDEL